jgi:glycosyltransferase involved in cell wall biosynthesis/ubiquinone/menaquinone biosynthesis C-methylase UbiE
MNIQTYDLSIITVCKNAMHSILATIESVNLAKNSLKIEHIVIDGLSTDGTKKILEELSSKKSIDVLISEKDNGIYDAMNKGIKISSGKIVYFLNSGDKLYDSKTLELAINAFNQNNHIDFIYYDHIGINPDGSKGYSKKPTTLSVEYFNKTNICHQAIFYRKDCFDRIGFFDTAYTFLADFDWNLRAFFQHDIKAAYIPYPACFFDNCGVHTHDKFREIVREERSRALRSNTTGKEHASFNSITLPTTNTSASTLPHDTICANKRVMFVAYGPNQSNGPNVWLQRLLPIIANRNFTPEVIFLLNNNTNCEVINNIQDNNITCHSLLLSPYTEQNIINILQVIKDRSPDFFVPNLSVPAYFSAKWVKSAGIPTIGVIHSDDTFHHEIMDTFISGDSGYALSGAVCVSKFLHSIAQQNNGHGIPLLTSACGVPLSKKLASSPGRELQFIYTGRMIQRQKRIFDVIKSCHTASQLIQDTYFSFYGEDRESGRAIAAIQNSRNRNFMKYGGKLRLEDIYPTLAKHHAFLLLSDYEGMSISLMEAMACGLVPICTRTKSGSTEIIRHNENGLLVDNREEDFLNAVRRLKTEEGLWERLSRGARETIEKKYSIDICADNWANFLLELISKSGQKKPIQIPELHDINLPPVKQTENGMCREDKRMPRVQTTNMFKPEQNDSFLNPRLVPDFADLFIVRNAIKNCLDKHLASFHGTLLDIGCGQMPYRNYILNSQPLVKRILGLDFDQGKYAALRKPDITWNGRSIPLDDGSIDCAMATEVLEHCHNPLTVLKEIHRVLKPSGIFFFTVPFLWPVHDAPHDHYRYTPFAMQKLLSDAGFEDVQVEALGGWNASLAQMIGLWLKRAPMSEAARKQATTDLFPFYEQLTKTDVIPTDFNKNPMITGLSGLARAARTHQAGLPESNLTKTVVVTDQFPILSQTFILDQITGLMDRGINVQHWSMQRMDEQVVHEKVHKYGLLDSTRFISIPPEQLKSKPQQWLELFLRINSIASVAEISSIQVHFGPNYYKLEPLFTLFPDIFLLVSFHGYDGSATFKLKGSNYYDRLFKRANMITTPSHFMKDNLVKFGCPEHKIVVHRYGKDLDKFMPATGRSITKKIRMLSVARLVEKKGLEYAIAAFAKIPNNLDVEYRIAGDGPLLNDLIALARSLGVANRISFLGKLTGEEVQKEMASADIFVLTSITGANGDQEGVPVSLIEAQAFGLPVVSSWHAGIPELVEHEQTGFLASEKNIAEIAGYMLALIKNPSIRQIFSKNARSKVLKEFNIKSLNDSLASYLRSKESQINKQQIQHIESGKMVICPICQGQYLKFKPFGRIPRQNALCPSCGALERHRLIFCFLQKYTNLLKTQNIRMLHFAPEPCLEKYFRQVIGQGYLTADLYSSLADIKIDITNTNIPDNRFDMIQCCHVLEHIAEDTKAMKEIYRILKQDGIALIMVPLRGETTSEDLSIIDPTEREKLFGQADHVRYYGIDIADKLMQTGFNVILHKTSSLFTQDEMSKMGLVEDTIFICQKNKY